MKKNKTMRIASCLLVAVLLTTCIISGTFAKYVTSGTSSDSARVAKFGVTVQATTSSMFKQTYERTGALVTTAEITNSVSSSNTDNVIAPGTSGSLTKVTLSGTPEVAVRVSYNADLSLGESESAANGNWVDKDGNYYCPLEFTINGTTYKGLDYTSVATFETAVENAINGDSNGTTDAAKAGATAEFAPNTNLANITTGGLDISWNWAFSQNTDAKDTYLGNQAANSNAATVTLNLESSVTQID